MEETQEYGTPFINESLRFGAEFTQAAHIKALLLSRGVNFLGAPRVEDSVPKVKDASKPQDLILGGVAAVEVRYNPSSELVYDQSSSYLLYNGRRIIPCQATPKPPWWDIPLKEGLVVGDIIRLAGCDRLNIYPFSGCFWYSTQYACRFCGVYHGRKAIPPRVRDIGRIGLDAWLRLYNKLYLPLVKSAIQEILGFWSEPHLHFLMTAGDLPKTDLAWKLSISVGRALRDAGLDLTDVDSILVLCPPRNLNLLDEAHEVFRSVGINIECSPRTFSVACPGKSMRYGYEYTLRALKFAVKTFGEGYVRSNLILGIEDPALTLSTAEDLADSGVAPSATVFWPKPTSSWRDKAPPNRDTVLWFFRELAKLYREYGYRPIFCPLSSRSSLENEAYLGWL